MKKQQSFRKQPLKIRGWQENYDNKKPVKYSSLAQFVDKKIFRNLNGIFMRCLEWGGETPVGLARWALKNWLVNDDGQ